MKPPSGVAATDTAPKIGTEVADTLSHELPVIGGSGTPPLIGEGTEQAPRPATVCI
jgi:hypothetical protein